MEMKKKCEKNKKCEKCINFTLLRVKVLFINKLQK